MFVRVNGVKVPLFTDGGTLCDRIRALERGSVVLVSWNCDISRFTEAAAHARDIKIVRCP